MDAPVKSPSDMEIPPPEDPEVVAARVKRRLRMGAALFLSPNTVKSHLRAIYRKLGARSREAALVRARALGLLDPPG